MNILRVCHLLIALLVFQTAVAFYDSHEELQDVATHVPPHHQDAGESVEFSPVPDRDSASSSHPDGPDFCHHCCHCHGVGVVGILGQAPHFSIPAAACCGTRIVPPLPPVISPRFSAHP
ncbi:hypothetical protein [Microbulbifer taiwanensis]|uniref:hypothetical protein n=1 Tax=Microbulbifer taiwanensis TaxID=986746 RepID=UPI00361AC3E3